TLASVLDGGGAPAGSIPLRVPVAPTGDAVVREPAAFARHVVRHVARRATTLPAAERARIGRLTADTAQLPGRQRRKSLRLGADLRAVTAQLGREVTHTDPELGFQLDPGEAAHALTTLVETFRAHDAEPFLVFDDTDAWGNRPDASLVASFFEGPVRLLATELDCGFALAMHRSYVDVPEYRALADRLEPIGLPRLPDPASALRAILQRRLDVRLLDFPVAAALDDGALDALAAIYAAKEDVRRAIVVAGLAVRIAIETDARVATRASVERAAAERDVHAGAT
ncbi:MAG TPA: hypothetical protein VF257_12580, partial [Solirubrobacteraceae bacterium]